MYRASLRHSQWQIGLHRGAHNSGSVVPRTSQGTACASSPAPASMSRGGPCGGGSTRHATIPARRTSRSTDRSCTMEFPPQHEASAVYAQPGVVEHNEAVHETEPTQPSLPSAPTEVNPEISATHATVAAPLEPGEEAEPASEETGGAPTANAPQAPKRAPRPSLPPQKGTTVFPLARIAKIVKVGPRALTTGRQCRGHLQQRGNLSDQCCNSMC